MVEKQEAFKDPHLTLQDVAERSGYNRTYVSGIIKAQFGGFFAYINALRLQHVEAYLKENPSATIYEAAEVSGFGSRQAYYAAKARLGKGE
ncbi:MAG: helix-turn-helix transcriptional regulator [Bacteroidales bacterium]|nr:helix-turn-helix transcriptional regulator [Bacteroidales bacterium]